MLGRVLLGCVRVLIERVYIYKKGRARDGERRGSTWCEISLRGTPPSFYPHVVRTRGAPPLGMYPSLGGC